MAKKNFKDRTYVTPPFAEVSAGDLVNTVETSANTLRHSIDGNDTTVIKYLTAGDVPAKWSSLKKNYTEIKALMKAPAWVETT